MSEVRVHGVSLYYEEHGAGEPILCIHGAGSSAAFWAEAAEELAAHGRAIVYDRRGCFRSERPEPYATSVRQQADDQRADVVRVAEREVERDRAAAAAETDMCTVAETLIRVVLGEGAWEGFPEAAKQMFTGNRPAIVAEFRGGVLDVGPEQLGTIVQPTLVVAAEGSPPAFAELTKPIAAAMPSARLERVAGGHAIDPAHPVVLAFGDEVLTLKEEPSIA